MTIYMQNAARAAKELPMSEAERKARIELAACYRIFDMLGWTELIFNHITLRVPGSEPRFLINPFGLHYREITASSLVLIDLEGNVLRESKWPVNRAGFVIHSAIHGAVAQAHCVMHTHTTTGCAVAGLKDGLSYDSFYGAMLYGSGAGPNVISNSNFMGAQVALDLSHHDHAVRRAKIDGAMLEVDDDPVKPGTGHDLHGLNARNGRNRAECRTPLAPQFSQAVEGCWRCGRQIRKLRSGGA